MDDVRQGGTDRRRSTQDEGEQSARWSYEWSLLGQLFPDPKLLYDSIEYWEKLADRRGSRDPGQVVSDVIYRLLTKSRLERAIDSPERFFS